MNISIITVGKLKEKYLKEGVDEYKKRMTPFASVTIKEVADEKISDKAGEKEKQKVKEKEGQKILDKLQDTMYVFALDPNGKEMSSEDTAVKLDQLALHGKSKVAFIIGGSLGLDEKVLQRADFIWSFSKLTFPHQLMRLILMEQLYRAYQINTGTAYHK